MLCIDSRTLKNKNQVHATKRNVTNISGHFETHQEAYCRDRRSKPGLQVGNVNTDFVWGLTFTAIKLVLQELIGFVTLKVRKRGKPLQEGEWTLLPEYTSASFLCGSKLLL